MDAKWILFGKRIEWIHRREKSPSNYRYYSNPFTGRVICGYCGRAFGRKTWNSTDENFKRRVWQCNRKYEKKGEVRCKNKHIDEEILIKHLLVALIP